MNPFEENNINFTNNILINDINIEIWIETFGRKKNTYISGWNIPNNEIKEYLKIIKKKNGCNGTIKKYLKDNIEIDIIMLQGDHIQFMTKFLNDLNITLDNIHIKG